MGPVYRRGFCLSVGNESFLEMGIGGMLNENLSGFACGWE